MPVYTFSRPTPAYLSDGTRVAANTPRFEQGKSVMVEEGTTNIIPIADWNAQNGWTLAWCTQTRTIETTGRLLFNGVNIIKSVIGSTGQVVIYKDFAVSTTPGVVYTISAFVKSQGRPVRIWCHDGSDNGQVYSRSNIPGTDFTRLTVNFTTTGTGYCRVHFLSLSGNVGDIMWVTAPQLEQKPYATSFIDGTRAAESLTIPMAGVLNPQEGTVECWVMAQDLYVRRRDIFTVNEPVATQDRVILGYNVTGTGLELNWRPANAAQFFIRATDISPDTDWVHVGFRYKWNGTGYDLALIYNGQVVSAGIATNGQMTNFIKAFLGCTKNGSIYTYFANMLFDDLRISSCARSDAEILAAYQSGQPLPADEWTTLKLNFSYFESIVINSSVSGVGRKLTRQATNISSAMTMTGRATRGKRAHATANAAVSISGTARRLMRTSAAINITLGLIGRLWNAFQRIYFLLSHIEYKPDLFVEEYVINLEHVDYEIKLEVIGLAISGSTITLKATFQDSAGDLQELENVVVKIYAPGKVLLETIPATKISTGVYTADYTIPEDKEGQFDYEFSGSLGNRTIVGRSSFDSHWR